MDRRLRRGRRFALLAAALVCALLAGAFQRPTPARIPVLVLTGENTTDWRWTSTWMQSVLERSGRFDVEVALYPSGALADQSWLERFDVFVLNYQGERWGEPAESNFLDAVHGGSGVVAVAGSSRAFPGWTEYHDALGCKWDESGGADPFGAVALERKQEHPLAQGLGNWDEHRDSLLLGIEPRTETHDVLATATRIDPATGAEERVPVVLAGRYGKGRAVTATLGNVSWGDERTWVAQTDPQFQQLLIRACDWAADGEVRPIRRVEPNTLTEADRDAGWRLLFDGETMSGWEAAGEGMPAESWTVQDGAIVVQPLEDGRALSPRAYEQFELELEWKVAEGVGADLRVVPRGGDEGLTYALDGAGDGRELRILRPPGEYNRARIVATREGVEHWLNGVRLATCRMTPAEWARRVVREDSTRDEELVERSPLLKIVLENRGASVWLRNVKIRRIEDPPPSEDLAGEEPDEIVLFDGDSLEGWTWVPLVPAQRAPSAFRVEDGVLMNDGLPIGYLRTDSTYDDFELELDWRMDPVSRETGPGALMLRIHPLGDEDGENTFWPRSLDVRLGTNEAGDLQANRNFPMQADPRRWNGLLARRLRDTERRAGEWNHLELRLAGGELVVRVNGEVVNAATEIGGPPGWIGLHAEGREMHYRGIVLRPLGD